MDPEVEVILNLLVNVGMDAADIAKLRKTVQDTLDSIVKGMQAKVGAAAGKQAGTAAVGQMQSVNKLLLQEHKAYLADKARLDAKEIADDLRRQGRQDTAQRQATARANAHADRLDAASNTKHRQTMQTRIENNRAGQHRMTQDNGAEASKRLVSARSADAYLLNEQRSANARLLAADQQHGARRTALYRTVLNNLTRANQTGMTLIVNAWRSHQAKVLETQRTGNRREESELNASLSRRQTRLQANLAKQNAIAARGSTGDRTQAILGGSVAGKAIGRGVLGLGGLFAGGVGARKVFDILSEYQGIETAFKGLFDEVKGGAPRTTAFLKDMQEFAKVTPFSLKQVATSAQKLFTTRVINIDSKHAQAELKDWLEALSNAASATGKGGEEMDRALLGITQIGGAGKLKTQDLRQITENIGLPLEEVAKALGLTTAELFDELKKGSIDSKTGLAAVLKALKNIPGAAGAAERQSKTLAGAWSTLKDTGEQLVVRLLMPAGKAFAALTVSFATLVGQFLDGKGAWKVLRDGLMGIVVAMGAIFAAKGAVTVVKLLGIALSAVAAAPVISGLVALSAVLATFPGISKILGGLVEGTKNWFLVGYRANAVIDGLGPVAKIASTLGKAARFIQSFSTALIVGSKDWFLVGYRIKGVITDFSNIVKLQSGIGAAARVIKEGLVGIGRAFGLLFQDHDTEAFKKNIGKAIDAMSKGLGPIRDLLVKEMRLGVTNLNKFILEKLPEVGKFISQNIAKIAPPAAAVGGGLLIRLLGLGGGGIKGRLLKLGIGSLIGAAVTYGIKEFDTAPATASLGERLSVIFENAAVRAKEWKLNIGDFLSGLFTQNKDLGDAGGIGRSIRDAIGAAIKGVSVGTFTGFFGDLGDKIFGALDAKLIAKWAIDLPRKFGKALSRVAFSKEFLKVIGGLAVGLGAAAVVVGFRFIRGFVEGMWSRRGDVVKVVQDVFKLVLGDNLFAALGARIAVGLAAAFAGAKVVSLLNKKIGDPIRRFAIGYGAADVGEARAGLRDFTKTRATTSSPAANLGMTAARLSKGASAISPAAITQVVNAQKAVNETLRQTPASADQAARGYQSAQSRMAAAAVSSQATITRTAATTAQGLNHYAEGWKGTGRTALLTADILRQKAAPALSKVGSALDPRKLDGVQRVMAGISMSMESLSRASAPSTSSKSSPLSSLDPRKLGAVQATLGNLTGRYNTFRSALARDLPKFGGFVSKQAQSARDSLGSLASRATDAFKRTEATAKRVGASVKQQWDSFRGVGTEREVSSSAAAISASLTVAGGAFGGYMAGMASDAATASVSIAGSAANIANAFAQGPFLGVVTLAATALGAFFGNAAKKAKQAAAEAAKTSAAVRDLAQSYLGTFKDVGSTGAQARTQATLKALSDTAEEVGINYEEMTRKFGISTGDLESAAARGGKGMKDLRKRLIESNLAKLMNGDTDALGRFNKEAKAAADSALTPLAGDKVRLDKAKELRDAWLAGSVGADELKRSLVDLGYTAPVADIAIQNLKDSLRGGLESSAFTTFLANSGVAIDQAIKNYKAEQSIGDALRSAMEAALPYGEQFVAIWEKIKTKTDSAKTAAESYLGVFLGKQMTEDEATDSLFSRAESFTSKPAEGESPEAVARRMRQALSGAQVDLSGLIAEWAKSGDPEKAKAEMNAYFDRAFAEADTDAEKAFIRAVQGSGGLSGALAQAVSTFTPPANLLEFRDRLNAFLSDPKHSTLAVKIAEAPDFQTKKNAVLAAIGEMSKEDPTITTYITKDPEFQANFNAITADINTFVNKNPVVKVKLQAEMDNILRMFFSGQASVHARNDPIAQNWNGGLETSPTLSTLAERGPEAIFPLTNPRRMRQILAMPPVAQAFAGIGVAAPSFGSPDSGVPVHGNIDQSMTNTYNIEATDPQATADEIFRRQRAAKFLGGHTLVRPRR